MMFRKDKIKLNTSAKIKKNNKPQRVKVEVKNSRIGKSFSFKPTYKKSIFGDKTRNVNNDSFFSRFKLWQIILAIFGVIAIIAAIIIGILVGRTNDSIDDNDVEIDDEPIIDGVTTTFGTFLSDDSQAYVLCEYSEYFSGDSMIVAQKPSDVRYDYKPYWVFISYTGEPIYNYSGEYTGEITPEQIKADMFDFMSNTAGYTPENIAQCDVHIYEPVSFTSVVISSATIAEDGSASIKYKAGALDGEMSEEYELIGTYTKTDNAFAFSYESLPEDETLIYVLDNLLMNAVYESKVEDNHWANKLVFGGSYELTLIVDSTDGE